MLPDNRIKYTIRVYMLILNDAKEILLSDEFQLDMKMVKFPGGGMEYGEGPVDCLRREAREEFGLSLINIKHFYTTEHYQKACFYDDHQLISIYYTADLEGDLGDRISNKPFDFPELTNGQQSFRWAALKDLEEENLSFPIDQIALRLLKREFLRDG